jgi:type II secretory pathway component GspD/PulD (secretin)
MNTSSAFFFIFLSLSPLFAAPNTSLNAVDSSTRPKQPPQNPNVALQNARHIADSLANVYRTMNSKQMPNAQPARPDSLRKALDTSRQVQTAMPVLDTGALKAELWPFAKMPGPDSVKVPVLDFKNTDIRDILRALGMQYNINIYLEPDVTGPMSLYLVDIPVKKAIDFIIKRANFAYTVENNILKVYKYSAPLPPPPKKPAIIFHSHDGILDINVKGVSLHDVAQMFVDSAGLNVVIDGKIEKEISGYIKNLKPEKAIKVLCETNDLLSSLSDGIYYISQKNWGQGQTTEKGQVSAELKRLSITVTKDKRITLEVDNAPLDQVIRNIAIQSGLNVIIYENITGTVSAKFDSLNIDDVIRFLLQNTKFTFWKDKAIYFLGSREMSQQKTTLLIPLRHIMADEEKIVKILPPTIAKDAVIKYDKEHNSLIVIGSFDIIADAQEFFAKVDQPIPQVLIEALVVDFNLNKIRDYGLSVFTQGAKDSSGNWLSEQFLPSLSLKPGINRTQQFLQNILNDIGVKQIVELPANFRSQIHALESADVVKVHSTPQIATINGNAASITIGETRYYKLKKETDAPVNNQTAVIGTDERFEVIKFNTQLEVTPWVMDKGYVMCKIKPEFNIPQTSSDPTIPPNVNTRVIESMVRLRNGQTIVLGGQRQTENMVNSQGIPILSSIPILGWLFSSKTVTTTETQMMIFLTPHVYYGDDNAVSPDDYFGKEVNKILDQENSLKKKRKQDAITSTNQSDSAAVADQVDVAKKKHWWWFW